MDYRKNKKTKQFATIVICLMIAACGFYLNNCGHAASPSEVTEGVGRT